MASFNKVQQFVEGVAEKVHNLGADTLKVVLTNSAPVMRSLGTIAATLLLSVLATGTALAVTRVVDLDGQGSATNCGAVNAAFTTITAAITAANAGDIIKVCPGIYNEQLIIKKRLTIRGDNGAILKPGPMSANTTSLFSGNPIAAAIVVTPGIGPLGLVTIDTLTVDGADNGFGAGCSDPLLVGIFYRNASGTIDQVAVKNMKLGPSLLGCQTGLGIFVQSGAPGVSNVTVEDSSVHDYQKNGITGNEVGTTIHVLRNVVTGSGVTGPSDAAQNGVQIGFGAKGEANSNFITNNVWGGCTPGSCSDVATNILVAESDNITMTSNTVGTANVNIYIQGNNGLANFNAVFNSVVFDGIAVFGDTNKVAGNAITNSGEAAVYVDGDNNSVVNNKINDTPIGVLKESGATGTVLTGNVFVNTAVLFVDPVLSPLNLSPVR